MVLGTLDKNIFSNENSLTYAIFAYALFYSIKKLMDAEYFCQNWAFSRVFILWFDKIRQSLKKVKLFFEKSGKFSRLHDISRKLGAFFIL